MWDHALVLSLVTLLMLAGVLGSLIPILPSTPLVFLGALTHWLCFPHESISLPVLVTPGIMMLISLGLDFFAGVIGAKKLGASWRGMVGVILGGLAGFFFGLPGLLVGPFAGAILFETIGGSSFQSATKAGLGAVLGILAGAIGRFAFAVAMSGMFLINLVYRQFSGSP